VCKACVLLEGLNKGLPKLGIGKSSKVKKTINDLKLLKSQAKSGCCGGKGKCTSSSNSSSKQCGSSNPLPNGTKENVNPADMEFFGCGGGYNIEKPDDDLSDDEEINHSETPVANIDIENLGNLMSKLTAADARSATIASVTDTIS